MNKTPKGEFFPSFVGALQRVSRWQQFSQFTWLPVQSQALQRGHHTTQSPASDGRQPPRPRQGEHPVSHISEGLCIFPSNQI